MLTCSQNLRFFLDISQDLQPDIVGSVLAIPAAPRSFDVALCCQVLEHLPLDMFGVAAAELRRVTRGHLILSLPDIRRFAGFELRFEQRTVHCQLSLPRWPAPVIPPERMRDFGHLWEIGYGGSPCWLIRRALEGAGWRILEVERVSAFPWHTFFFCTAA